MTFSSYYYKPNITQIHSESLIVLSFGNIESLKSGFYSSEVASLSFKQYSITKK